MSDPYPPSQPPHEPGQYATPYADPYGGPPTADYYNPAAHPKRPVSTIVLGIIGILYAAYLTLCVGAGLVFMSASGSIFDWLQQSGGMSAQDRAQIDTQLGSMGAWPYINGVLFILVGVLGWVGAIGSFMGREWGRKALLLFSAAFILVALLGLAVEAVRGFPSAEQQIQAQQAQGGPGLPKGAIVGMTIGCNLVFLAFPIAVLIVYTRDRVKQWFKANSAAAAGAANPYGPVGGPPAYGQ